MALMQTAFPGEEPTRRDFVALGQRDPASYYQQTPLMRAAMEGLLPSWLGQAFQQDVMPAYEAAEKPWEQGGVQGALDTAALPAQAVVGLLKGAYGDLKGAMDNPTPESVFPLAVDVATGGLMGSAVSRIPKGALGANVWQGGPHKYGPEGAAKSLEHMSKGEGNQMYGWGRYDAGNEIVAGKYKKPLAHQGELTGFDPQKYSDVERPENLARNWLTYVNGASEGDIKSMLETEVPGTVAHDVLSGKIKEAPGYLYKHDLPDDDIARYLDWDKPLSEQPQAVQDIAKRYGIKTTPSGMKEARGSDIYHAIGHAEQKPPFDTGSRNPGSREGSEALGRAGIPGLKYMDQLSRGKSLPELEAGRQARIDTIADMRKRPKAEQNEALIAEKERHIVEFDKQIADFKPQTHNYVTWDEGVLGRMKLLERNGLMQTGNK